MLTRPKAEIPPPAGEVRHTRESIQREIEAFDWSRIRNLTDEEIERAAASDPDNPECTDEELARGVLGRSLRLARQARSMSLPEFAAHFRLPVDGARRVEEGYPGADPTLLAYLAVILREPEAVERALDAAEAA